MVYLILNIYLADIQYVISFSNLRIIWSFIYKQTFKTFIGSYYNTKYVTSIPSCIIPIHWTVLHLYLDLTISQLYYYLIKLGLSIFEPGILEIKYLALLPIYQIYYWGIYFLMINSSCKRWLIKYPCSLNWPIK